MMMQPELLTDAVKIYRVRGLEEQQQGSGVEASRELPQPVAHLACYPTLGRTLAGLRAVSSTAVPMGTRCFE